MLLILIIIAFAASKPLDSANGNYIKHLNLFFRARINNFERATEKI